MNLTMGTDLELRKDNCASFDFMLAWKKFYIPKHSSVRKTVHGWYKKPPTDEERSLHETPGPAEKLPHINERHVLADHFNKDSGIHMFQKVYRGLFRFATNPALVSKVSQHSCATTEQPNVLAQRFWEVKQNIYNAWLEKIMGMQGDQFQAMPSPFSRKAVLQAHCEKSGNRKPTNTELLKSRLTQARSKIVALEEQVRSLQNQLAEALQEIEELKK